MKVKELLNLWINGHSEHILSVPWRDLSRENVPYGLPFSNRFGIRLSGLGYPFKNNCHPFERLWLSVREKLSSVRTAWAIRLKKIVIRSNGLGYPFEKIVIRSNGLSYLFEKEFVASLSYYQSIIDSIDIHFIQYLSFYFFNKFPVNNIFYLLRFCSL